MTRNARQSGSRLHRSFILALGALLTLLLFGLLGFVLKDIGDIEHPDYAEVKKQYVDQQKTAQVKDLRAGNEDIERRIKNQREIQQILRGSAESSRETMNQLLEMHRFNLENEVKPSPAEVQALAASESLFLANQKKFQEANEQIAGLSQRQRDLQEQVRGLEEEIKKSREPANTEINKLRKRHRFKVAALKLLFLLPLTLIAAVMVMKKRTSPHAPILNAILIATCWRLALVMHKHFPAEFFKYIAIAVGIVIVLAFLIQMIRTATSPKLGWLIKQYRSAYGRHVCPICQHPILRGPLKHATWTPKGPRGPTPGPATSEPQDEQPYTCPSCGEKLYEKCESCDSVRHALLPYCESCGSEKGLAQASPETGAPSA